MSALAIVLSESNVSSNVAEKSAIIVLSESGVKSGEVELSESNDESQWTRRPKRAKEERASARSSSKVFKQKSSVKKCHFKAKIRRTVSAVTFRH